MTLRRRFLLYLLFLHALFAVSAVWFLRAVPMWLIAVEGLYVISLALGLRLLGSFFQPLDLIRSGADYLRDGEFTTRFRPTGQPDMDQLVEVYNRMVDTLREERVRNEEQEHLLHQVLTESPGGVITFDVDGRIDTVNPTAARLLDATAGDLTGRSLEQVGGVLATRLAGLPESGSEVIALRGRSRVRSISASLSRSR